MKARRSRQSHEWFDASTLAMTMEIALMTTRAISKTLLSLMVPLHLLRSKSRSSSTYVILIRSHASKEVRIFVFLGTTLLISHGVPCHSIEGKNATEQALGVETAPSINDCSSLLCLVVTNRDETAL